MSFFFSILLCLTRSCTSLLKNRPQRRHSMLFLLLNLCSAIVCPPSLSYPHPISLSPPLSLTVAQDESASMCPCSSSLSGAPWWSSSSFSNWAPTAGWNYSSPPTLSLLFLNKCDCCNRGVLLIHLYCVECAVFTELDRV